MSDEIPIGPNPCNACGGEYGQHAFDCRLHKLAISTPTDRDGRWMDKWGACKVCDGEIPHGHSDNCDLYKLEREVSALKSAIAAHHGQKADDRCIFDDDRLYAAAGLPPCDRRVGSKEDMLKNCARFIERRCEAGGWKSYAELERECQRLDSELNELVALTKEPPTRTELLDQNKRLQFGVSVLENRDEVARLLQVAEREIERHQPELCDELRRNLDQELAAAKERIKELEIKLAALKRGEFICAKCGLRTDGKHEKGEF